MARFPLVVDEGTMQRWNPIVVFGPRAADILDYVHKGGTYTVRGEPNRYQHEGTSSENVKLTDFGIGRWPAARGDE